MPERPSDTYTLTAAQVDRRIGTPPPGDPLEELADLATRAGYRLDLALDVDGHGGWYADVRNEEKGESAGARGGTAAQALAVALEMLLGIRR